MENVPTSGIHALAVVEQLGLQPHPEGGWYRETWRGLADGPGSRGTCTAILFLLEAGQRSRWHRVDATEIWFYHAGAPLRLFTAPSDKQGVAEHRLGPDVTAGDHAQHVIAPGCWQSAEAIHGWCLVSCVVVPAFEFSGFEIAPEDWQPTPEWGIRASSCIKRHDFTAVPPQPGQVGRMIQDLVGKVEAGPGRRAAVQPG